MTVALVDAGDYAGCTSSASSKLLHGGLRYLSTGDVGLVRQLQSERRAIAKRIAPHLVSPLPLLLAVAGGSRIRTAKLAAAMPLYAALSGFRRPLPRRVSVEAAARLIGPLRPESIAACGLVTELQTHDARLTLATARAAARAGAVTTNYVRVIGFERESRSARIAAAVVEDVSTGEQLRVSFRTVVNATGPYVDVVRALEQPGAPRLVRLSVGVHVVLPLIGEWRSGLALFDDASTTIAIPWQGMLLVGATDTPHDDAPGPTVADPADIAELLGRFADLLPREHLLPGRAVHSFVGFRALPLGTVATPRASRRHVVAVGSGGVVSIAGGKLTAHRLIAMDALRNLPADVRPRRRRPLAEPLGHACSRAGESLLRARLDPDVAGHLIQLYGADAPRVAAYGDPDSRALDRIDSRGPDIWAQVDFARDEEWALTVDDIVARRTTLAVRGLASADVRDAVLNRLRSTREGQPLPRLDGVFPRRSPRNASAAASRFARPAP